jgi:hypothetical protein
MIYLRAHNISVVINIERDPPLPERQIVDLLSPVNILVCSNVPQSRLVSLSCGVSRQNVLMSCSPIADTFLVCGYRF